MRIWLVTIGESIPQDGPAVRLHRTGMMALHLAKAGHEVTWWNSGFDHSVKRHRDLAGDALCLDRNLQIRLMRGCGYKSHVSLSRLLDHRQVARSFLAQAEGLPIPDAIVAGYPIIELADACRTYAERHSIPFALDIRDLWPDIFVDLMPRPFHLVARMALWPYSQTARRALAAATAIIGVTRPYLDWGLTKANRAARPLDEVIPFSYPASTPGPSSAPDPGEWIARGLDPSRHTILCFFGTFGRQFDIETIIRAGRTLAQQGDDSIRFILCGSGDNLDAYKAAAGAAPCLHFPGWIDSTQIRNLMAISSLGLAPYFPNRNFVGNIPNKPIEYLSAGLPILTCLDGLLADTVRREDIGLVYRSGDHGSLIAAVRAAQGDRARLTAMGVRAKSLFDRQYRSDIVMEQYHQFILRLAASQPRAIPPNQT